MSKYDLTSADVSKSSNKVLYDAIKRVLDIVGSILGLAIAAPIIAVFGLLVRLETPGTAFYSQERLGKNGKSFSIYKIRSMYIDAEANGAQWADKEDSRITRMGKFIRKTRIDELPQLLNILKGDMSIVGPRPERDIFAEEFSKEIPNFNDRLMVKPGLTGLAQVNGGYEISPKEKLKYDLYYIKHRSLWMDLSILFRTVFVVIKGDGAR